jgi:hypothetical protein
MITCQYSTTDIVRQILVCECPATEFGTLTPWYSLTYMTLNVARVQEGERSTENQNKTSVILV